MVIPPFYGPAVRVPKNTPSNPNGKKLTKAASPLDKQIREQQKKKFYHSPIK